MAPLPILSCFCLLNLSRQVGWKKETQILSISLRVTSALAHGMTGSKTGKNLSLGEYSAGFGVRSSFFKIISSDYFNVLTVQGFLPATLTLLIEVGLNFYFKLYFLDDDEEVKIIYKGMG